MAYGFEKLTEPRVEGTAVCRHREHYGAADQRSGQPHGNCGAERCGWFHTLARLTMSNRAKQSHDSGDQSDGGCNREDPQHRLPVAVGASADDLARAGIDANAVRLVAITVRGQPDGLQ